MNEPPKPFGATFVPAIAAFLTCFAIGVGLSVMMGVELRIAVPAGMAVSATVAFYVVLSQRWRHTTKR